MVNDWIIRYGALLYSVVSELRGHKGLQPWEDYARMSVILRIRNWARWQTYRSDRGQPPWIKIHRSIMRDMDWINLSDAQRGQLVMLWLLAADNEGQIPANPQHIQRLCYLEDEPDINYFIDHGFLELDASVTPPWRQPDANMTPTRRQPDANTTPTRRQPDAKLEENEQYQDDSDHDATVTPTRRQGDANMTPQRRIEESREEKTLSLENCPDLVPVTYQPTETVRARLKMAGCLTDPADPTVLAKFIANQRKNGTAFTSQQTDEAYIHWCLTERSKVRDKHHKTNIRDAAGNQRKGKAERTHDAITKIIREG